MTALPAQVLTQKLAALFAALPQVEAISLGGSRASGAWDDSSDIDLYIYTRTDIPLVERQALIERAGGASQANLDMNIWGLSDQWIDAATGVEVDFVYFDAQWMEDQLQRVVHAHQANLGYTTSFWRTIRYGQLLYDRDGWLQSLQQQGQQVYPEALRRNIIALNQPVLRNIITAYMHQLEKAVQRMDRISINHRLAALLASYFDIIFALNRVLHPGEKRMLAYALRECPVLPINMAADIDAVFDTMPHGDQAFLERVSLLLDRLDHLLEQEGFYLGQDGPKGG